MRRVNFLWLLYGGIIACIAFLCLSDYFLFMYNKTIENANSGYEYIEFSPPDNSGVLNYQVSQENEYEVIIESEDEILRISVIKVE